MGHGLDPPRLQSDVSIRSIKSDFVLTLARHQKVSQLPPAFTLVYMSVQGLLYALLYITGAILQDGTSDVLYHAS
jgi:hypothetical protein